MAFSHVKANIYSKRVQCPLGAKKSIMPADLLISNARCIASCLLSAVVISKYLLCLSAGFLLLVSIETHSLLIFNWLNLHLEKWCSFVLTNWWPWLTQTEVADWQQHKFEIDSDTCTAHTSDTTVTTAPAAAVQCSTKQQLYTAYKEYTAGCCGSCV